MDTVLAYGAGVHRCSGAGPPRFGTTLAILRGFLHRRPIFAADLGNVHHRLFDRALTPRTVVLVLYGCCVAGAVSLLAIVNQNYSGFVISCSAPLLGSVFSNSAMWNSA